MAEAPRLMAEAPRPCPRTARIGKRPFIQFLALLGILDGRDNRPQPSPASGVRTKQRELNLMPSYEHKKLIERISQLDELSEAAAEYAIWIKAYGHLTLLRDNGKEDELIIYASGNYTLIHTVVASEDSLSYLNKDDLLHWSSDPFSSCASYVWGGGRDDVWIERGGCCNWGLGSKTLENERELVFERSFERWKGEGRSYFEILQEYSHLTEIHWRPEERAYCRFDEHGDLDHVVSVTSQEDIGVVSFRWDPLQRYLAASNSVLLRMFDFTLLRRENFTAWPDEPENVINESDRLFLPPEGRPWEGSIYPGCANHPSESPKVRNILINERTSVWIQRRTVC